jgi:ABC-type protease/lipase transport system fused ATPase/permease subunit
MKQQVALARAFFGDPDLIVLDEPAAWVDQSGQNALMQAIDAARSRGAGVVLITHLPALLRNADTIAVMRGGAIEMVGPRGQIMQRIGVRSRAPDGDQAMAEATSPRTGASGNQVHSSPGTGSFALAAPISARENTE